MVGKTFKGMTDELLAWQTATFPDLVTATEGGAVAMRPELVVEIELDGVQRSPRYPGGVALRFARVLRYRPDKGPRTPTRSTPSGAAAGKRCGAGGLPDVSGILDGRHRLTTAGLVTLVTFVAFEAMAVATVLPTAVAELDGLAWYGWPFTAFLVAQVVGMVLGGDLGDRRGPRVALLWGVGVFAAGLVASGLAVDMPLFVLGGPCRAWAAASSRCRSTWWPGAAFDPRMRPALFGALSAAWVVPALVGPLLAGLLTSVATWRLVFLGILPLVAAGLALVLPALRRLAVPRPARAPTRTGAGGPCCRRRRRGAAVRRPAAGPARGAHRGRGAGRARAGPGPPAAAGHRPRGPRPAHRRRLPGAAGRRVLRRRVAHPAVAVPAARVQPHRGRGPAHRRAVGWSVASALQGRRPDLSRSGCCRRASVRGRRGRGTALVAVGALDGWPVYATWAVAGLGMGLGMSSVGVLLLEQSPSTAAGRTPPPCRSPTSRRRRCASAAWRAARCGHRGLLPLPAAVLAGVPAAPPSRRWAARSPVAPGSRRPRRPHDAPTLAQS